MTMNMATVSRLKPVALVVAVPLAVWMLMGSGGGQVTSDQAHALVKQGARLVDVRTREEYAEGHITGAVNVAVDDLTQRLKELAPKDKAVIVYCASGHRSRRAAELLRNAGFTQVFDLGGIDNWVDTK
jgi:phage shock protein E